MRTLARLCVRDVDGKEAREVEEGKEGVEEGRRWCCCWCCCVAVISGLPGFEFTLLVVVLWLLGSVVVFVFVFEFWFRVRFGVRSRFGRREAAGSEGLSRMRGLDEGERIGRDSDEKEARGCSGMVGGRGERRGGEEVLLVVALVVDVNGCGSWEGDERTAGQELSLLPLMMLLPPVGSTAWVACSASSPAAPGCDPCVV